MIDKKLKPVVQGGVDNYLGKQPQVQAPRKWQSSPDKPETELAYITEAEKDLILKANIHGGLEGGPNMGPSGIMSLDSFGDVGGAGASGGDTSAGGGANEGAGFSGQGPGQSDRDFDRQKANQRAALQIAERAQARNLSELTGRNIKERANIANATYGPLQKYTGERGFLGNLFRGANKYGYTDTYTSGPRAGQVKPGYFGRILGGIGSLLTGIPLVGGALGTAYDYGKGIFGRKPRDMTEFNKLGLGGVKPGTYDFDPNAKINRGLTEAELKGYSRFGNIGIPNINNLESLLQGIDFTNADAIRGMSDLTTYTNAPFEGARTVDTYRNVDPYKMNYLNRDLPTSYRSESLLDKQPQEGIMGIADASAPGNNFLYNTGNPYKDNLYDSEGNYDPYGIKGEPEPEVKEIAIG